MFPAAAIGIISSAMTMLNYEKEIIDQVVGLLQSNSDELTDGRQQVTQVGPEWFGGAPTAHRIGTNTRMAHQAVEEEFQKLADSLLQYSDAITLWGNEVVLADADTNAEMTTRAATVEQINAQVQAATQEAADRDMGDGTFDPNAERPAEPPSPAGAESPAGPESPASTSTTRGGSA